jgi:hypothetical protein
MLSTIAQSPGLRTQYLTEGEDILGSLTSNYLATGGNSEAVLLDGTDSAPTQTEVDTALIFGDYFFTEALLRLQGVLEGKPGWTLYSWNRGPVFSSLNAVPEPSTWAMMLLGFAGCSIAGYRASRRDRAVEAE